MRKFIRALTGASVLLANPVFATETKTYSYDDLGRLTGVVTSGSVNNGLNMQIGHDKADNRTTLTVTGSPFNGPAATSVIVVPLNGYTVIPIYAY